MKKDYREKYVELYRTHWWWRSREVLILELLTKYIDCSRKGKVLDIGCGEGLFFKELSRFGEVFGFEPGISSPVEHEYGSYLQTLQADRLRESFQLCLLLDVIEHVDDDESLLMTAAEVTARGGYVLITVPAYRSLWTTHDVDNEHLRRYTPEMLKELIRRCPFEIVRMGAWFFWPAVVKYFAGCLERRIGKPFRGSATPPYYINEVFRTASLWEGRIMQQLETHYGSSLFALCRKI